ncbi:MAG TPA: TraR/DksA C4-type zinc finger protein [Streptosporangiaceae bacterium]|nr:TraR/DksA C4-type zinc finger protein [Streptosporangiaceae bacterium]
MDTAIARKRLEEMLGGIDRSIAVLKGESPNPDGGLDYPLDPADAGANLAETDRTEAILDSAQRQRDEVLAALRRMDEGTYGLCVDCGKPVPDGRLEARPDAARCVGCQSKHDRLRR